MRIKVIQRIVPSYRQVFFNKLHAVYGKNFEVYTSFNIGKGPLMEGSEDKYPWLYEIGNVIEIPGACWQTGVFKLKINKGDIIVIEGSIRIISNFILILRSWLAGAKLVWWGHYWSASSQKFKASIRHQLMKNLPNILFYTDKEIERFAEDHSRINNIFSLNNGVDIETIIKCRNNYFIENQQRDIDILFLGRIAPKANIPLLLKAMLNERCLSFNLTLMGAQDEKELSYANKEIDYYDLKDRVTVAMGSSSEEDIAIYTNRSKVFCYPGQVGLSLIHAMSYGLPSIVHDNWREQMPEFCAFENNKTGISFKNNDSESLADAINFIFNNNDLLSMSKSSIKIVESKYTLNLMKDRFINMIDSIK